MKIIEELINDIISECEFVIKDNNYLTPNKKIIGVILQEFNEIKDFYVSNKKVLLLSNKTWKLLSIRIIIDSADYNFDSSIFDKVRKFEKYCNMLDMNLIEYRY